MWENRENPKSCPISLLAIFKDYCPFAMLYGDSPFYLMINNKRNPESPMWYNWRGDFSVYGDQIY